MSLAAHGWGAVIALEYAITHPKRVDSIILLAPISPFAPDRELTSMVESLPKDAQAKIVGALDDANLSVLEKQEVMMREILPELFYRREAAEDLKLENLKYASDVRLRLGEELKCLDLFTVLGDITQPTLVIAGRHDISIPVRDQMAYADGIKHASAVVFNESGHFPFLEEHAFFVNLVKEFLHNKSVPALAGSWPMP
jgi:proline iminopeptidase